MQYNEQQQLAQLICQAQSFLMQASEFKSGKKKQQLENAAYETLWKARMLLPSVDMPRKTTTQKRAEQSAKAWGFTN